MQSSEFSFVGAIRVSPARCGVGGVVSADRRCAPQSAVTNIHVPPAHCRLALSAVGVAAMGGVGDVRATQWWRMGV